MRKIFLLVSCLFLYILSSAQTSVITPELQEILSQKNNDLIDINIVLKSQMPADNLSMIGSKGNSKSVRREMAINELKNHSELTQKDLMDFIQAEAKNNKVTDIKQHWLVNSINCKATRDVIYQLASHPDIEIIGYDKKDIVDSSNDSQEYSPARGGQTVAQHITHINADKVWKLGYTGKGIVVAIIDTGVNYDHDDLKDHLWKDPSNSYPGYNFLDPGTAPSDDKGHGTHCAGVVGGDGTSGTTTGIAPDATLMCLKVNSASVNAQLNTVVTAVEYAVEKGADVISISKNGWASNDSHITFRNLFDNTLDAGIITLVSAGNYRANLSTNLPIPGNIMAPANCPPPYLHPDQTLTGGVSGVMCIGSVGYDNNIAVFSSQGPVTWEGVSGYNDYPYNNGASMGLIRPDLVAPGENIVTLDHASNGTLTTMGTSISTPIVAGVVALMLEKNPDLTPAEICRILENTATKLTPKKSNDYGSGCVDALAAVQQTEFNTNDANVNLYSFSETINAKQNTDFSVTLINNGKGTGSGNVSISTTDGNITVNSATATYNNLASGQTTTVNLNVSVNSDVPDQHIAPVTITIDGKIYDVEVSISNELVPPTNIISNVQGTSITLSWEEANNATSYNIYRDEALVTNVTSTTYLDENLEYGTLYNYTITTKRNELESEHSQIVRVQTEDNPNAPSPTNVAAIVNVDNVDVTWTNSLGSLASNVYRKNTLSNEENKIASDVNGTSYTDNTWNTLQDGIYQYGVANLHTAKEDVLYETNFTTYSYPKFENADVDLTDGTSLYPTFRAYWYQYNTKDGGDPYKWSFTNSIVSGAVGSEITFNAFDGKSAFIVSKYNTTPSNFSYLVSPTMKFTEHNGKTVKMSFRYITPAWGNNVNTLKVMTSTSYNSGWTEVWSSNGGTSDWTEVIVDLSEYINQEFYIAFVNVAGYGYCTGVDNVSIYTENSKESRIEWSDNVHKGVNVFVKDGLWSDADNWATKQLPTENDSHVIIDANATIASGNITLNSLTINEGKSLELYKGVKLTVNGDFTNTDTDAFIINDGAQVVQNNDDVAATFNMNIIKPTDWGNDHTGGWQFIASPMKNAKITDFVPQNSDYDLYRYDGSKDLEWINHKDNNIYDDEEDSNAPVVTATANGRNSIILSWAAVEGATGYIVYSGEYVIAEITETTYTVNYLQAGTEYCFSVSAVLPAGESAKTEACATTEPPLQLTTVEIGEDQNPNGNYNYYLPTCDYTANYSISQQLYTAAEIGFAGKIHSISFRVASGNTATRNLEVYAQNTELTYLSSPTIAMTASDKVFEGNIEIGSTGSWFTITFDTPFDYTGNNLLICVNDKTGVDANNYHTFYKYAAANRGIYTSRSNTYGAYNVASTFSASDAGYVNQIELQMEVKPMVIANTESIDLGNIRLGNYWPENEESAVDVTVKPVLTNVTSIESTNPFFTLSAIDYNANPITFTVSYDKNANVSGEVNGNLVITYDHGVKEIPMTATAYTPETPDVYELAQEITFKGDTYTNTPNFATLHDDYTLPKEVNDGSTPDAVYHIVLDEAAALEVNVSGTNAKYAIYKAEDLIGSGPSSDNNYEGFSDGPTVPTTFFYDFEDGSLADFTLINGADDNDGGLNWEMCNDGYNSSKGLTSYSYFMNTDYYPENYLVTANKYLITENSVLSFYARSYSTQYPDSYKVMVSSDGTSFEEVKDVDVTVNSTSWVLQEIDLSASAGQELYIAVNHYSDAKYQLYIDDLKLTGDAGASAASFPAGEYYLVAAAENAFTVTVTKSEAGEIPEIPAAPTVTAVANDSKSITLSWDAVEGATSYIVYYKGNDIATITETTYTINGLAAETEYCYSVSAVNVIGESEMSDETCATTEAFAAPTTFFYDFNDGDLSDFTIVDANGNGYTWSVTNVTASNGFYGKGIIDYSYKSDVGAFYAEDFIYTKNKYSITEHSKVSFDVQCSFYGEKYAVVVYTDNDNYEIVDGTSETVPKSSTVYHREYSLAKYAGKDVQIGFYHYDSYDAYALSIDNFQLTDGSAKSRNSETKGLARLFTKKNKSNKVMETVKPSSSEYEAKASANMTNANGITTSNNVEKTAFTAEVLEKSEQTSLPPTLRSGNDEWTTFQQGVGYLASYESETNATFKGTLNHENSYVFDLDYNDSKDLDNFHLLGNPFSFNINWENVQASDLADGYAVVNEDGGYDYATSGEIKVGDGFFVKAINANPSLSYNTRGNRNNDKKDFLNIIATGNSGDDNVIVQLSDTHKEGFPKIKNFNEDIAVIYVNDNDVAYGVYNCSYNTQEVELSFKVNQMGKYNIHIEPNGMFNQVTLIDKLTNTETDMLAGDYSFTTTVRETSNRFLLRFSLSGDNSQDEAHFAYQSGNELIVNTEGVIQIIDMMGRVLFSKEVHGNSRINISNLYKSTYLIRCIRQSEVHTQKIVVL